jgi:hypothetical protein
MVAFLHYFGRSVGGPWSNAVESLKVRTSDELATLA